MGGFADPISDIDTVTTFVPQSERDNYFWSGANISTPWVPVLSSGANLTGSTRSGKACTLIAPSSIAGFQYMQFPAVSRFPTDPAKLTVKHSYKHWSNAKPMPNLYAANSWDEGPYAQFGANGLTATQNGARGWALWWRENAAGTGADLYFIISNGTNAGAPEIIPTGITSQVGAGTNWPVQLWGLWEVDISEANYTLSLNGVVLCQSVNGWSFAGSQLDALDSTLVVTLGASAMLRGGTGTGSPGYNHYFCEVGVSYV